MKSIDSNIVEVTKLRNPTLGAFCIKFGPYEWTAPFLRRLVHRGFIVLPAEHGQV